MRLDLDPKLAATQKGRVLTRLLRGDWITKWEANQVAGTMGLRRLQEMAEREPGRNYSKRWRGYRFRIAVRVKNRKNKENEYRLWEVLSAETMNPLWWNHGFEAEGTVPVEFKEATAQRRLL